MNDPYFELINKQLNNIAMMYNQFRDKKPIIEYLVNSEKIYSYPADDYINTLSAKTRDETTLLYNRACNNRQFLLFIKDEQNQKLKSYLFDIP